MLDLPRTGILATRVYVWVFFIFIALKVVASKDIGVARARRRLDEFHWVGLAVLGPRFLEHAVVLLIDRLDGLLAMLCRSVRAIGGALCVLGRCGGGAGAI